MSLLILPRSHSRSLLQYISIRYSNNAKHKESVNHMIVMILVMTTTTTTQTKMTLMVDDCWIWMWLRLIPMLMLMLVCQSMDDDDDDEEKISTPALFCLMSQQQNFWALFAFFCIACIVRESTWEFIYFKYRFFL